MKKNPTASLIPSDLPALTELEQIQVEGKLTIDDITTIVSTRAEDLYGTKLRDIKQQIAVVDKRIAEAHAEVNKQRLETLQETYSDTLEAVRKPLKPLGGKVTLAQDSAKDETLVAGRLLIETARDSHTKLSFQLKPVKVSAETAALQKQRQADEKEKERLTAEGLEWKKRQANIPAVIRSVRAQIAASKLKATKGGEQLLDMLMGAQLDQKLLTAPV